MFKIDHIIRKIDDPRIKALNSGRIDEADLMKLVKPEDPFYFGQGELKYLSEAEEKANLTRFIQDTKNIIKQTGRIDANYIYEKIEFFGKAFPEIMDMYPAIKEAKARIRRRDLGELRKIFVEYPQGWLSTKQEDTGNAQASWRTDPKRSGKAGCMGDIGTHAHHLAEYVTGLRTVELCAELNVFVPGRLLDDDGAALLRFDNGARGVLVATQIAAGEENALKLRVYGENGGLEWCQHEPNTLLMKWSDRPTEIVRVGNGYMSAITKHNTRTPGGHPEGYLEAFANIYRNFSLTLRAKMNGQTPKPEWLDFPNVEDGIRGMMFIDAVVKAGYDDTTKWVKF